MLNDGMLPMFHEQTVLELLDAVPPRAEVVAGVRRLRARGFRIGLSGGRDWPAMQPLLELADFIRVKGEWDALMTTQVDRPELVRAYLHAVQWADTNIHTLYD